MAQGENIGIIPLAIQFITVGILAVLACDYVGFFQVS